MVFNKKLKHIRHFHLAFQGATQAKLKNISYFDSALAGESNIKISYLEPAQLH